MLKIDKKSLEKIKPFEGFKKPECPLKKKKLQIDMIQDAELGDLQLIIPYNVELSAIAFRNPPIIFGKGGQGCVMKGTWLDDVYAVKEMELVEEGSSMLKEVLLTSYVTHQNIIRFCGVAPSAKKLHLILEYLDGYNLKEVIFINRLSITSEDKQHIALKQRLRRKTINDPRRY